MIISASRRTDLPAFYPDWLFNRFREGRVLVRNPMNPHAISDVRLSPDVADGIVLWTKNPLPMLSRLSELYRYPYYFQFTLTAYGTDVEPSKTGVLAPAFQTLSRKIGRERVVWRYDPIFFSARYTADEHCRRFRRLRCLGLIRKSVPSAFWTSTATPPATRVRSARFLQPRRKGLSLPAGLP